MKQSKQRTTKDIIGIAGCIAFLAVYLVLVIWMSRTKTMAYFAGVIWKLVDINYVLLALLYLGSFVALLLKRRKTTDAEERKKLNRSLRINGIVAVIWSLLVALLFLDRGDNSFAELKADENRSILLCEDPKGERITVYCKKGCLIREIDNLKEFLYANANMVTNGQYTWESDGDSVTVRFDTGGLAEGISWREDAENPAPSVIQEKQYQLDF